MELRKSKTIWLIRVTVRFRAGRRRCGIRIDFVQAKLCQQGGVLTYEFCEFLNVCSCHCIFLLGRVGFPYYSAVANIGDRRDFEE